jgi:hypothetical protein
MCKFFENKRANQGALFLLAIVPFIVGMISFDKDQDTNGYYSLYWLGGLLTGAVVGYGIKERTVCRLAHLPENVEVEPSQVEGQQRNSISMRNP